MSKVKQALLAVKIIIAIAAIVIGYIFYQNYAASQEKIAAVKKVNKFYNNDKWAEAVEGYKAVIEKYPDKKAAVASKLSASLQNMANAKSIEAMAIPKIQAGKKKAANQEVVNLLEEAKEYDDLNVMSYQILCEAYVECGDIGKAKGIIKEAETHNIQASKFGVQVKRIEQLEREK